MNSAFKKSSITQHRSFEDVFGRSQWQQNGIKNSEVSKEFYSDAGEVVKISGAAGNEWVKLNPTDIPEQLIKSANKVTRQ